MAVLTRTGPQVSTVPTGSPFSGATFNGSTQPTPRPHGRRRLSIRRLVGLPRQPTESARRPRWASTCPPSERQQPHRFRGYQGQYGDTHYYLISTPVLPLLLPLKQIPIVGNVLADALDPTMRVLVESAYDRGTSPGVPTPWNPLYLPNLVKLAINLVMSIPTGLDNSRTPSGPVPSERRGPVRYGFGGPTVRYTTDNTTDSTTADAVSTEATATDHPRSPPMSLLATPATATTALATTATPTTRTSKMPTGLTDRMFMEVGKPRGSSTAPDVASANPAGGADGDSPSRVDRPAKPKTGAPAHHEGRGDVKAAS